MADGKPIKEEQPGDNLGAKEDENGEFFIVYRGQKYHVCGWILQFMDGEVYTDADIVEPQKWCRPFWPCGRVIADAAEPFAKPVLLMRHAFPAYNVPYCSDAFNKPAKLVFNSRQSITIDSNTTVPGNVSVTIGGKTTVYSAHEPLETAENIYGLVLVEGEDGGAYNDTAVEVYAVKIGDTKAIIFLDRVFWPCSPSIRRTWCAADGTVITQSEDTFVLNEEYVTIQIFGGTDESPEFFYYGRTLFEPCPVDGAEPIRDRKPASADAAVTHKWCTDSRYAGNEQRELVVSNDRKTVTINGTPLQPWRVQYVTDSSRAHTCDCQRSGDVALRLARAIAESTMSSCGSNHAASIAATLFGL